jgi:hypothetical protein
LCPTAGASTLRDFFTAPNITPHATRGAEVAFSSGSVQAIIGRNEALERRYRDQP